MRYRTLILALGALSSSQVSAGEFQSVYVAPGGVYIASGQVYVRPGNVDSPYVAPGPMYYEPRHVPPGPRTSRVMCHRGRYTELPPFMEQLDQCTRLRQPTLTDSQSTHPLTWQNFHCVRPPLCHTSAMSAV